MLGSICNSRLYHTTCFLLDVFSLLQHVDFVTTSFRLGSKSMSLKPGFCVARPGQYDMICWRFNLISGFFVFFWLIARVDGTNKCDWCLAGDRG